MLANAKPRRELAENELPNGEIEFQLIRSLSFNAVAFVRGRKDRIGINIGVMNTFSLFSILFMHDSLSFAWMGNPSDRNSASYAELLREPEVWCFDKLPEIEDHTRTVIGARLNLIAYTHLLRHEMAHIIKCHIPFLFGNDSNASYAELSSVPLTNMDCRIRRALELDADHMCFPLTYRHFQGMMESGSDPEITNDNHVEIWAASLMLLYQIMSLLSSRHGIDPGRSTHPSAAARLTYGMSLYGAAPHLFGTSNLPEDRILRGMVEVMRWWKRAGLPGRLAETEDGITAADEEVKLILADAATITDQLKSLQFDRKRRLIESI